MTETLEIERFARTSYAEGIFVWKERKRKHARLPLLKKKDLCSLLLKTNSRIGWSCSETVQLHNYHRFLLSSILRRCQGAVVAVVLERRFYGEGQVLLFPVAWLSSAWRSFSGRRRIPGPNSEEKTQRTRRHAGRERLSGPYLCVKSRGATEVSVILQDWSGHSPAPWNCAWKKRLVLEFVLNFRLLTLFSSSETNAVGVVYESDSCSVQ